MITPATFIITILATALLVAGLCVGLLHYADRRNRAMEKAFGNALNTIDILHAQIVNPQAASTATLQQRDAAALFERQVEADLRALQTQAGASPFPEAAFVPGQVAEVPPDERPELQDLADQM